MSRVIALTGATGFIGGVLARRMEALGWQVRALVRPSSGKRAWSGTAVEWVEGDLGDMDGLRRLVRGVEAVVHCAGSVRGATKGHFERVNAQGVAGLVSASLEQDPAPRFLLMSSLAAREPTLSHYAASKREGERALAAGAGPMEWVALRPPAVYGPGDRELLPLFRWMGNGIAPVLNPNRARFSLIYVEDLAEAVVRWVECKGRRCGVFELHDGRCTGYGWDDVIETVARLRSRRVVPVRVPALALKALAALNLAVSHVAGYPPILTPGKVRELRHSDWVCDNAALTAQTGWVPRVSLEEGLRRTFGWGGNA